MKKFIVAVSFFALSIGYVTTSAQAGIYGEPYCREFTQNVSIGSGLQSSYGTACQQPDGSWKIVSGAAPVIAAPATVVVTQPSVRYVYQPRPYVSYRPVIHRHVSSWRHDRWNHRRHGRW